MFTEAITPLVGAFCERWFWDLAGPRVYHFFFLEPLLVLIEYVPYGDLLGYLRKSRGLNDTDYKDPDIKPQTSLTSQQLMKFAWQNADGMSYLSSRSASSGILI